MTRHRHVFGSAFLFSVTPSIRRIFVGLKHQNDLLFPAPRSQQLCFGTGDEAYGACVL